MKLILWKERNIDRRQAAHLLEVKSCFKREDINAGNGKTDFILNTGVGDFVESQAGNDSSVTPADKFCQSSFVHEFQMVADGSFAQLNVPFLHLSGNYTSAHMVLDFRSESLRSE